jgi:hypothetical protein
MSRELDEQCARALGWEHHDGWWTHLSEGGEYRSRVPLSYSEHTIFTSLLEDEIERRRLQEKYIDALLQTIDANPTDEDWRLWQVCRATPEQRARAFLEAVKA